MVPARRLAIFGDLWSDPLELKQKMDKAGRSQVELPTLSGSHCSHCSHWTHHFLREAQFLEVSIPVPVDGIAEHNTHFQRLGIVWSLPLREAKGVIRR